MELKHFWTGFSSPDLSLRMPMTIYCFLPHFLNFRPHIVCLLTTFSSTATNETLRLLNTEVYLNLVSHAIWSTDTKALRWGWGRGTALPAVFPSPSPWNRYFHADAAALPNEPLNYSLSARNIRLLTMIDKILKVRRINHEVRSVFYHFWAMEVRGWGGGEVLTIKNFKKNSGQRALMRYDF